MFVGSHTIIQSTDAEADKAFLRDVLGLPSIDSGGGWLIFGLPPSEVAIHPSSKNDAHDFYLICEDITAFLAKMKTHKVACSPIHEQHWGRLVQITLPGGGKLGVYQALHARPSAAKAAPAKRAVSKAKPAPNKAKAKPTRKKAKAKKA